MGLSTDSGRANQSPFFMKEGDNKYMGIASLVFAVISLFMGLLTRFFFCLGPILSVVAILFGLAGRRKEKGRRLATAGVIFSGICLVLNLLIVYIAWFMPLD